MMPSSQLQGASPTEADPAPAPAPAPKKSRFTPRVRFSPDNLEGKVTRQQPKYQPLDDRSTTSLPPGELYRLHYVPDGDATGQNDATQLHPVDDAQIRNATTIAVGGLIHNDHRIGGLHKTLAQLTGTSPQTLADSPHSPLLYAPVTLPTQRFKDGYDWNLDKHFISPDAEALGALLWKHKFLDENGALLPSESITPWMFFTYSSGNRITQSVENYLYERLTEAGKSNEEIAGYFHRLYRFSVASAVDFDDMPRIYPDAPLSNPPRRACVPSLTIFNFSDRGVMIPESFAHEIMGNTYKTALKHENWQELTRNARAGKRHKDSQIVDLTPHTGDPEGITQIALLRPRFVREAGRNARIKEDAENHGLQRYAAAIAADGVQLLGRFNEFMPVSPSILEQTAQIVRSK